MSPSRPRSQGLTLVLAAIDARATIAASLAGWREALGPGDELIVIDSSRDGTAAWAEPLLFDDRPPLKGPTPSRPAIRLIRRPPGRLVPELWRDGLNAATTPLVAFSTAQMVPAHPGWRTALVERLDATGAAAAGGPIEPARDLSARDRAVYLQRYVTYMRPLIDPARAAPPGENAVYRRERLAGLESRWAVGFWEVEIQRALRARGERLAMVETAAGSVAFQGGTRRVSFLRQRWLHGFHYGAERAGRLKLPAWLARLAATPGLPFLLLIRIGRESRARSVGFRTALPMPALPYLMAVLGAWTLGESLGLIAGRFVQRRAEKDSHVPGAWKRQWPGALAQDRRIDEPHTSYVQREVNRNINTKR